MSQVITLDDLRTYMVGTTVDDGLGQLVVDGVNSWIDSRTGRLFGETKQVTERYDWKRSLWLRHMDIINIDEITLGLPGQTNTVLPPSGYYLNPLGRVSIVGWSNSNGFPLYSDYVSVKYTYGYTSLGFADDDTTPLVPDDLRSAALGIAAGFYNWGINGQRDVSSVSVGSYQIQYTNHRTSSGSAPDSATSTADANWSVIESYKLRRA